MPRASSAKPLRTISRHQLVAELDPQRLAAARGLALDVRVDLRHVAVIRDVEKGGLQKAAILVAECGEPARDERFQLRRDYARERFAVARQIARSVRRQPADERASVRV